MTKQERERAYYRRWAETHPEAVRAKRKRYRDRVKADPERREHRRRVRTAYYYTKKRDAKSPHRRFKRRSVLCFSLLSEPCCCFLPYDLCQCPAQE